MKFIKKFESYEQNMTREEMCDMLCSKGYKMSDLDVCSDSELANICSKYLEPKGFNENEDTDNYMFFANLQNICNMVTEILKMEHNSIDSMLTDGHDWAADHISKSKESISHVYNWLKSSKNEENM
jgi:hypothetical protein